VRCLSGYRFENGIACASHCFLMRMGLRQSFGATFKYNKTYGSIGAVIVFLTWLYLTGLCLLIGGEINTEIEHAAPAGKAPGQKASL